MDIKWNEEYVKEKIEEYLEIFNQLGKSLNEGLARSPSPTRRVEKKNTRGRMSKKSKANDELTTDEEESNGSDDDNGENERKTNKKIYYAKKSTPVEEEINFDDSAQLSVVSDVALEPLAEKKRQPAQQRVFKELSDINQRIASLIQIRQMGLSTPENTKQYKQLMQDRKKKAYELRRLQLKVQASNRYRDKRRQIV
jgi:hypothetical protein